MYSSYSLLHAGIHVHRSTCTAGGHRKFTYYYMYTVCNYSQVNTR